MQSLKSLISQVHLKAQFDELCDLQRECLNVAQRKGHLQQADDDFCEESRSPASSDGSLSSKVPVKKEPGNMGWVDQEEGRLPTSAESRQNEHQKSSEVKNFDEPEDMYRPSNLVADDSSFKRYSGHHVHHPTTVESNVNAMSVDSNRCSNSQSANQCNAFAAPTNFWLAAGETQLLSGQQVIRTNEVNACNSGYDFAAISGYSSGDV